MAEIHVSKAARFHAAICFMVRVLEAMKSKPLHVIRHHVYTMPWHGKSAMRRYMSDDPCALVVYFRF